MLTTAGADVLDDELPVGNAEEAFHDDLRLADRELSGRLEHILADLVHRATLQFECARSARRS